MGIGDMDMGKVELDTLAELLAKADEAAWLAWPSSYDFAERNAYASGYVAGCNAIRINLPAIREQADEIERLREFAKSVADLSDTGCDFIDGVLLRTSARAALNPQKENSHGVQMGKFSRLTGDDAEEFSFYSDGDECVITQHRYYRWGGIVLAVGEINEPNTWDDAYFDAKCAELETIFARITELEAYIAAEPERMREVVERCARVAEDYDGPGMRYDMHCELGDAPPPLR